MERKKIHLVGPGGCGITWMYALFGEAYMKGDWSFHNVHQRFTQVREPEKTKILYLTAHPVNIILSYERRFWQPEIWVYLIQMIQGDINGLYNITEPCDGGEKPTLERYAEQGLNLYDFHQHAAGWKWYCKIHNIEHLFIRYEDIPDRFAEIEAFVGKRAENYEWIARNSDYETDPRRAIIHRLLDIHFDDIRYWEDWNIMHHNGE